MAQFDPQSILRTAEAGDRSVGQVDHVHQRSLLNLPTDNEGLDPDTDDTSIWSHTAQIWEKSGSMVIGVLLNRMKSRSPLLAGHHCYLQAEGADLKTIQAHLMTISSTALHAFTITGIT